MRKPIENSVFKFISSTFSKHNIPCVLVGGYALIANKVQRMTFDVDLIISEKDFNKLEIDVLKAGYEIFNKQKAFVQFRNDKEGFLDIDFLLTDSKTIEILIKDGHKTTIAGEIFVVPSPLHLVAMKLHSISNNKTRRAKDYNDIVQLIRMNNIDPRDKEIQTLFEKYKAGEIHKDLLNE